MVVSYGVTTPLPRHHAVLVRTFTLPRRALQLLALLSLDYICFSINTLHSASQIHRNEKFTLRDVLLNGFPKTIFRYGPSISLSVADAEIGFIQASSRFHVQLIDWFLFLLEQLIVGLKLQYKLQAFTFDIFIFP